MANQIDAATLTALTNALTAFTAAIAAGPAAVGGAAGGAAAPAAVPATTDLHEGTSPYDLNKRNGLAAYDEAKAALPFMFDGSNATYPNLIHALQQRIRVCNWNPMTERRARLTRQQPATSSPSELLRLSRTSLTRSTKSRIRNLKPRELLEPVGTMSARNKMRSACTYASLHRSQETSIPYCSRSPEIFRNTWMDPFSSNA